MAMAPVAAYQPRFFAADHDELRRLPQPVVAQETAGFPVAPSPAARDAV